MLEKTRFCLVNLNESHTFSYNDRGTNDTKAVDYFLPSFVCAHFLKRCKNPEICAQSNSYLYFCCDLNLNNIALPPRHSSKALISLSLEKTLCCEDALCHLHQPAPFQNPSPSHGNIA